MHRHLPLGVVLLLALMVLAATGLSAGPIIVQPTQVTTPYAIRDSITGADMTGMTVRMVYGYRFCSWPECNGPYTNTMTWEATGPTSGAAMYREPWWDQAIAGLWLDGETSGDLAWEYGSMVLTPLMSIELDGTYAGVYFDRASPNPGTPGSGPGSDFAIQSSNGLPLGYWVAYENAVAVGAYPPQNDLYSRLVIHFWFGPGTFRFTQDTDQAIVPEPASGLLVCGGLVGLRAWRKRRQ